MEDLTLPAIAAGDELAFRRCLARHQAVVRALARRLGCLEIDDAVQDVFTEIWLSSGRYDDRASERTFILTIARRRLVDRWRRRRRRPIAEPLDELVTAAESGSGAVEAKAEVALALESLRALRPERRDALMLSACAGMSHQEIADTLGIPLGTAKAHVRRAVHELRRALTPPETTTALAEAS